MGIAERREDDPAAVLLSMALSRPREALAAARALIATGPDPLALSFARQAVGIVLRDSGQSAQAVVELRAAVRAARVASDPGRIADARASLGAALVMAGRTRPGLVELDAAAAVSVGQMRGRVLLRRAYVLMSLGRHAEALLDVRRALADIRLADDRLWEARALNNRAMIHVARGALTRADVDIRRAEGLFREEGQALEEILCVHNRGLVAYCRGDLPGTLIVFSDAARRYEDLGVSEPELAFDQCRAYLAAGLTSEAVAVVDDVLATQLPPVKRAELLYAGADAALAGGDVAQALERGRKAQQLFGKQGRDWWAGKAELVALRARQARGDRGRALVRRAAVLGEQLVRERSDDAPLALLMAGRLAAERWPDEAHEHLRAVARYRRHVSPLVRATGWLGQALDRELTGDARGVLTACGRGLDALDEHRSTLGSSELRALASGHGQDLARLALREAVRGGDPRRMLAWSERWRAAALTEPPVRPPRDSRTAGEVGALRSLVRRRDEALMDDPVSAERDRRAWEQAERQQRHQLAGTRRASVRFDVGGFVDQVRGTSFVELAEVDGVLHAMTVRGGRVRHTVVGPVDAALQAVAAARFVLRQTARDRPSDVRGVGERLQRALLGTTALGDGPVVIAPPSRLHDAPFALLPTLTDRPISVVPSAAMWLRACSAARPDHERLVLVAGPGLGTGGAEVDVLARREPGALLLRDGRATVEDTLAALDGATLAHVAAHGHFRPDSPMFSSLLLDDGPLTVHDLELLERAPYRLVLSACDSGVMVPVGADELLGLTAALLSLGTAGVVSSVAEVNDEATVDLMLDLHAALAGGAGLAEAMYDARTRARGDVVREATAAAFVALGV